MTPPEAIEGGVGPLPEGGYPVPEPPTDPGPTRERWLWTGLVVGVGLLIFGMMVFGGGGGTRPDLQQVNVADILSSGKLPSQEYGSSDIEVVGWYAAFIDGCQGTTESGGGKAGWLEAECPLRVLLPTEPAANASQADLLRAGLRLAAPDNKPFPPPAPPGSGTAGLEQLAFQGHFNDATAASCSAALLVECQNTFVVSTYTGQIK